MPAPVHDQIAHFWARVDRSGGPDACWPWTGATAPYGHLQWRFPDGLRHERAHRIAFMLETGELPRGRGRNSLIVRHRCDNPPCCNPGHLELGTHRDNAVDRDVRGRLSPAPRFEGEGHPRARLTSNDVRTARLLNRNGVSCQELARRFSIGGTTMAHALAGRTWRNA